MPGRRRTLVKKRIDSPQNECEKSLGRTPKLFLSPSPGLISSLSGACALAFGGLLTCLPGGISCLPGAYFLAVLELISGEEVGDDECGASNEDDIFGRCIGLRGGVGRFYIGIDTAVESGFVETQFQVGRR